MRRAHNTRFIKQSVHDADTIHCPSRADQSTYNSNVENHNRWLLVEYALILSLVIVPLSVQAGFFGIEKEKIVNTAFAAFIPTTQSAVDVDLVVARQNPDPHGARGGAEVVVNEGTLVSTGPVGADVIAESRISSGEISVYTVREGDTLSHIAQMYNVTSNTILWANDLPRATSIKVGQSLIILPIAGVQHTVKKGDTLKAIAAKYDGDVEEIISYNNIAYDGALTVGEVLVIPGGAVHTSNAIASPIKTSGDNATFGYSHPVPGAIKTQGIHGYNAVDFASAPGTTIRAAAAGEVLVSKDSGWNGGYGQYIVIKHSNGSQTLYAHLSRNDVGVGASVAAGTVIGAMGNTGRSTGPHLHFEVRGAKNPF